MVHESCKEMLAIHALSAVDATERRELQEHLDSCETCRLELAEWEASAATLALAAVPLEPAAGLRERILERVRHDDEDLFLRASPQNKVLPFTEVKRSAPSRWPLFGAIAAAILFLGLIVGLVGLWRQHQAARVELARLSQELQLQQETLAHDNKILGVLNSPGAHTTELKGTKDAPQAHALVAIDGQTGRTVLMAKGLPATPEGKAYQLWFISGGQAPVPGKVFKTDATGNGMLEDQMPTSANTSSVLAVTLEPQAGVTAPTGAMYLLSPAK